jgi:hypothetical protein
LRQGGSFGIEAIDPQFSAAGLHLGTVVPRESVGFRVHVKRKLGDIVIPSSVWPDVVSPKVVAVLAEGGFTGWSSFPVHVAGPMGDQFLGYRGLSIAGRSGPIDDGLSERVVLPPPVPEGRASRALAGQCPEPGSWDGSDLFVPEDTMFTCVTTSVRDALVTAGVVGFRFERMSEMTMPIDDE